MVIEVEGNLLTYPGIDVICHQVNCLGVMGAGIAKQIKSKFPEAFNIYYSACRMGGKKMLGECQLTESRGRIIANLFGEYSFTESIAPYPENRHTDYDALRNSLIQLKKWSHNQGNDTKVSLGVPYKIGCGLAGGDWEGVVYPMLKELFENDDGIVLYIVKWNGK